METTEALTTTDVNHATKATTRTTICEAQPPYDHNGEAAGETTRFFPDATTATNRESALEQKSRPVTAATARRRRLWEEGTLVLENPYGAYKITEITEDLSAQAEESDPEILGREFDLQPEQTLTFAPNTGDGQGQHVDGQCDHEWTSDSRVVEPARGHGHPQGPAPADREQLPDRCAKCGAKRTEVAGSGGEDEHVEFDEIDTKHALWHLRSALDDADCIRGRPILKMGITRDLRRAKRLLEDHAKRNGFEL